MRVSVYLELVRRLLCESLGLFPALDTVLIVALSKDMAVDLSCFWRGASPCSHPGISEQPNSPSAPAAGPPSPNPPPTHSRPLSPLVGSSGPNAAGLAR